MPTTAPAHSLPSQLTFNWAESEAPSKRITKPSARRPPSKPRVTPPAPHVAGHALTSPPRILPSTAPNQPAIPTPLAGATNHVAPRTPTCRLNKTSHVSELIELVLARYGISREEIEAELARN